MKKSIFAMAALALVFASCSNDEMLEKSSAPQNAIGFNTSINKSTRAVTDVTLANMGTFKVWGYESKSDNAENVVARFSGKEVTLNGSKWEYSPIQYWTRGNFYWFTGYSVTNLNWDVVKFVTAGTSVWPVDGTVPYGPADTGHALFGGTFYFNNGVNQWESYDGTEGNNLDGANGNTDLVYAWWRSNGPIGGDDWQNNPTDAPEVDFTFKHILSKVAFKFENQLPFSTIKVKSLVVNNVAANGTLDMTAATPAWNNTGTFSMNYQNDITSMTQNGIAPKAEGATEFPSKTSGFRIFLPANFTYKITFVLGVEQNGVEIGEYTHNVYVDGTLNLEMGKAYVLTASLNVNNIDPNGALEEIVFNPAEVEAWENATGVVNVPAN